MLREREKTKGKGSGKIVKWLQMNPEGDSQTTVEWQTDWSHNVTFRWDHENAFLIQYCVYGFV